MATVILTDSTCDISPQEAAERGVRIVPLKVVFGEDALLDGVDITPESFYARLAQSEKLPTTSQPSPDDFLTVFKEATERGDSVVAILLSSKISGTVQSATVAAEMAGGDIHVVDSLTTICSMRILVEHALALRDEGKSAQEIAEELCALRSRIRLHAVVDTLEYLHKGGRLSRASAILGQLLGMKPIVQVKDGVVGVLDKARGTRGAFKKIIEHIEAGKGIDPAFTPLIGYTAHKEKAFQLAAALHEHFGTTPRDVLYPVGCVIGTHAGPGACVVSYVEKA